LEGSRLATAHAAGILHRDIERHWYTTSAESEIAMPALAAIGKDLRLRRRNGADGVSAPPLATARRSVTICCMVW
jgi:hypothetical protein